MVYRVCAHMHVIASEAVHLCYQTPEESGVPPDYSPCSLLRQGLSLNQGLMLLRQGWKSANPSDPPCLCLLVAGVAGAHEVACDVGAGTQTLELMTVPGLLTM